MILRMIPQSLMMMSGLNKAIMHVMREIIPVDQNYLFPFNETNYSKCKSVRVRAHGLF